MHIQILSLQAWDTWAPNTKGTQLNGFCIAKLFFLKSIAVPWFVLGEKSDGNAHGASGICLTMDARLIC